jgi:cyanate permease
MSLTTLISQKWTNLFLYFCTVTLTNFLWISLASYHDVLQNDYGQSTFQINSLTNVFYVAYIIVSIPALKFAEKASMKHIIIISACANLVGSFIRTFDSYMYFLIGNIICGIASPFCATLPTKLSRVWFRKKERVIMTSVEMTAGIFGTLIGFLANLAQENTRKSVLTLNYYSFALCAFFFLLTLILFKDKKKRKAHKKEKNELSKELVLIALVLGITQGIQWTFTTIIKELMLPEGFDSNQSLTAGLVFSATGFVGTLTLGIIVSKSRKFILPVIISITLSTICSVGLTFINTSNLFWTYIVLCSIWGFVTNSLAPLLYEMSSDYASEIFSAGVLSLSIYI